MELIENKGHEIYSLAKKLFPICRSITGEGVRQTLEIISGYLHQDNITLNVYEIPSGTPVFDWSIPKEWIIREAYIEDDSGNRIVDIKNHNLHVMGYSAPVDRWVKLDELKKYVYTEPEQPDVIPYVTSYYKERYGFCMSANQLLGLNDGNYHMYIDSELFDGSLTYADIVIPGESNEEVLITSYTCHPSMANNECSGPAVLAALVKFVNSLDSRKNTYRFVLNPETIGSIAYINNNFDSLQKNVVAGVVLSCVGDDNNYSIIKSRYADTLSDKSLEAILKHRESYKEYSFLSRGSDERQYNAPGVDIPVVGFCRTKYGEFPEYHTSADNMDYISADGLQGSYETLVKWICCLEANKRYKVNVLGEPQLGKRGLYPTVSQKGIYDSVLAMIDFIAYADGSNDLFDISNYINVDPYELLPIIEKLEKNGLIGEV